MNNFVNNGTTASVPSLDEMRRIMASLPKMPRDVFRFDGTAEELEAALKASGVRELQPYVGAPHDRLLPMFGLQTWEIDGAVWIAGSYADVQDARDGKIPVKVIARPGILPIRPMASIL